MEKKKLFQVKIKYNVTLYMLNSLLKIIFLFRKGKSKVGVYSISFTQDNTGKLLLVSEIICPQNYLLKFLIL